VRRLLCLLFLLGELPAAQLQVLCYHRFKPDCGRDPYCVSDAELRAQLDWLKRNAWESVGLTRVARALDGLEPLPPKAVMLTVDDGYRAGARGAEAFEAFGYRGVFFVNPGSLAPANSGKSAFVGAAELAALEARGHDIGSHGLTHANLAKVPRDQDPAAYAAWLDRELGESRRRLEAILGHPITDLAWPYGAYNEAVLAAARRVGYRQFYTVTDATAELPGADRLRLPRFLLVRPFNLASFTRHFGAATSPGALEGRRDGEIIYTSGPWGFRFVQGRLNGRPARILVQHAPARWRPHFEALLHSHSLDAPHAP
jgi:peptidoglycan/xylan/chitin deacetylase (PgdA/CDA1 family)